MAESGRGHSLDGVDRQSEVISRDSEEVLVDAVVVEQRVRPGGVVEREVARAQGRLSPTLDHHARTGDLQTEEKAGWQVIVGEAGCPADGGGVRPHRADADSPEFPDPSGRLDARRVVGVLDLDLDHSVPNRFPDQLRPVFRRDRRGVEGEGHGTPFPSLGGTWPVPESIVGNAVVPTNSDHTANAAGWTRTVG